MYFNRVLLSVTLIAFALVTQVSLLARLRLPGATPDLLLLTVLGLALVYGHVGGSLAGFGAGLLADLAPPSDHAVGRYALVLCLVGYAAGLTRPEGTQQHRSAVVPMLVVGAGAVSSTLLYAGVGTLVGDTPLRDVGLGGLVLTAAVYDLLLAPFTVPLVMAVARRTMPDPAVDGGGTGGETVFGTLSAKSAAGGPRNGRAAWSSGRRSVLLSRTARSKVGRIKGVKRL